MEKKQNRLLLASAVFGAIFVVCIIIIWIFAVSDIRYKEFDFFTPQNDSSIIILVVLQLFMTIITFAFVFNLIGRAEGRKEHILIAVILYFLSLNLISAFLCLIVYPKKKREIKNKLLFYTMVYTFIFGILLIALLVVFAMDTEAKVMLPFWICFVSTVYVGVILNFIAWKTGNNKAKIIAGIAYVLGLFTLISAILCFISCKDNRKLLGVEEKAASSVGVL